MFGRGLKIFTLFGIPVYLDVSFFLIVPLFTFLLGTNIELYARLVGLQEEVGVLLERGGPGVAYIYGLLATLGVYLSVLIHEFGHALTAKLYKVRTERVTLWLLGGVASFERMPRQPGAEAVVAIAGPITSFIVAGVFWLIAWGAGWGEPLWLLTMYTLAFLNVFLAVFNLAPALPLDGGRVLRSLLALAMNYVDATRISAVVSKVLAAGLFLFGVLSFNIILMLIAAFVWLAVNAETQQSIVEDLLRGVKVGDLMVRDVVTVRPDMPAGALLEEMIRRRHTGFPVVDEYGRPVGLVRLSDLEEGFDPNQSVGTLMRTDACTAHPQTPAQQAFEDMGRRGFVRCLVVDSDGNLVGLVTKGDLMRLIQVRAAAGHARRGSMAYAPYGQPANPLPHHGQQPPPGYGRPHGYGGYGPDPGQQGAPYGTDPYSPPGVEGPPRG